MENPTTLPQLLECRCTACGLRFAETTPTDHPLSGKCPRCGEDGEHEAPDF